jgi:hypothetical protein
MMKDLHAIKEVDMRTKTERMVKCLRLLRSMRLAQQYTADDSKVTFCDSLCLFSVGHGFAQSASVPFAAPF